MILKGCPRCYGMYPATRAWYAANGYCHGCRTAYQQAHRAAWRTLRRGTLKVWRLDHRRLSLEEEVALREALRQMPPPVRAMLLLWAQGHTLKHIAACLGRSDTWIRRLMNRWAPTWREYHSFEPHATTPRMREKAREVGKRYSQVGHAARWQQYHPEEAP